MIPPMLVALAFLLLAPWLPEDSPVDSTMPPAPVVLVGNVSEPVVLGGFDVAAASRRVMDGTAARLRGMGVAVQTSPDGRLRVARRLPEQGVPPPQDGAAEVVWPSGEPGPVTLSVGFSAGATPWASGAETRFGGEGDGSWRLASRVQMRLVSGFRDVLGYRSYDRGVLAPPVDAPAGGRQGIAEDGAWVTAYPLFATNPEERSLLEWPETLELISAALADAVHDHLDPSLPTPPRGPAEGFRPPYSRQPVAPRTIYRADHAPRLALTFDGGASSAPTPAILAALREAGVKATMFMTADFVDKNPGLVVQMARDGHEFGNHSATHPDMTKLSDSAIVDELERLESAVLALTGKSTRPWFRPPYGAGSDRLMKVAAGQGYYTVMWTADSADWRPELAPATIQGRLLSQASPGAILIQHLGSPQSAQVLPQLLRQLKGRGMSFGTLSDVLGSLD